MQYLSGKKITLQERIQKVEKQNRQLKNFLMFLTVTLLALLLMGAKAALQDGHFKNITAEAITIVDGSGQELILLGSGKDGTGIRIMNKVGKRVVGIGTTADERGSGMLVADKEGRPRFGLGMDMGVPSFAMTDKNGKKIMAMGGDEKGYGLVIMDENEVERAGLGFDKGNAGILLYDDKGQFVRGMIREANGAHYSSYIDENGKEIIVQ